MRACLLPLKIQPGNVPENLRRLHARLDCIVPHTVDLICLPECTLSGYVIDQETVHRIAEPIPGPTAHAMAQIARRLGAFLCYGMIEADGPDLYNTSVLCDRAGSVLLKQRKLSETLPFRPGVEIRPAESELGGVAILTCGDLFNPRAVDPIQGRVDLLLVPMARSFDQVSPNPGRWKNGERQVYLEAVRKVGSLALLVNTLEDEDTPEASFGGALVVSREGRLLAEAPHGSDELVVWNIR